MNLERASEYASRALVGFTTLGAATGITSVILLTGNRSWHSVYGFVVMTFGAFAAASVAALFYIGVNLRLERVRP